MVKLGKRTAIVIVPAIMIMLALLCACTKETEQDKVKKVVSQVQKAVENKDISTVLSYVSKTYSDTQGNNYEGVKELLLFYIFKHPKESVFIPDIAITLDGMKAEAKFQAVLSGRGKASDDVLPEAMGVYNFEVSFLKEKGEWKIVSAKWERYSGRSE